MTASDEQLAGPIDLVIGNPEAIQYAEIISHKNFPFEREKDDAYFFSAI
jgi:hypothetical protein